MRHPVGFFQAVRRHFTDQKEYAQLMRMSDRELRDLGITRADVKYMASIPFRHRRY